MEQLERELPQGLYRVEQVEAVAKVGRATDAVFCFKGERRGRSSLPPSLAGLLA